MTHGGWERQESSQGSGSHKGSDPLSCKNYESQGSGSHKGCDPLSCKNFENNFWRQLSPMSSGSASARMEAELLKNTVRENVSRGGHTLASEAKPGDDALQTHGVFLDVAEMKCKVRASLIKPTYNVADLYKETGCWQSIATNQFFEQFTLVVIFVNAIWIAVDTDFNEADILLDAEAPFQIMENAFCAFFVFEWTVRFLSFRATYDACRDGWFVFDSVLVLMMVLETWILCLIVFATQSDFSGGMGNASVLRIARLLRLTRMARMARLLRAMPELMVMIKGMIAAMRSVFFTLLLQVIIMYVFGIAFTQLLKDTEVGAQDFYTVPTSMYSLLMYGTFLDDITSITNRVGSESPVTASLFLAFVLISALTVMNMLIGVLCEVVSAVAATEKETMLVSWIKSRMTLVLQELDTNGDQLISKNEFIRILQNVKACRALRDVGVDVVGLVDLTDAIFDCPQANQAKELTFGDFMDIILQLRGTNNATVKDIMDLRKLVNELGHQTLDNFEQLTDRVARSTYIRQADLRAKQECADVLMGKDEGVIVLPSSETVSKSQQIANRPLEMKDISIKSEVSYLSEDEGPPVPIKLTPTTALLSQSAGVDSAAQWEELPRASLQMCGRDLEKGGSYGQHDCNRCLEVKEITPCKRTEACKEKDSGCVSQTRGFIGGSHSGLSQKLSRLGEALSMSMYEYERIQQSLFQTTSIDDSTSVNGSFASENEHTPFIF